VIALGCRGHLKACRTGEPGTVIREERGKLTIYWADLDFWSRHQPESLDLAGAPAGLNDNAAQPKGETT
jgi:hypothetical protein